jgi:hypothetical protein
LVLDADAYNRRKCGPWCAQQVHERHPHSAHSTHLHKANRNAKHNADSSGQEIAGKRLGAHRSAEKRQRCADVLRVVEELVRTRGHRRIHQKPKAVAVVHACAAAMSCANKVTVRQTFDAQRMQCPEIEQHTDDCQSRADDSGRGSIAENPLRRWKAKKSEHAEGQQQPPRSEETDTECTSSKR